MADHVDGEEDEEGLGIWLQHPAGSRTGPFPEVTFERRQDAAGEVTDL
jgi:hypothetical protein